MIFVTANGTCANFGGSRSNPAIRGTGVFAALAAYTLLELFKKFPALELTRR